MSEIFSLTLSIDQYKSDMRSQLFLLFANIVDYDEFSIFVFSRNLEKNIQKQGFYIFFTICFTFYLK